MNKRLLNQKSVYNRNEWRSDYEKSHKYVRSIIKAPYVLNESLK